jgi:hypothetical protein
VEANGGKWWKFTVLAKKDISKINLFKVSPIDGAVDQATSLALSWKTTKTAIGYEYCYFPVDNTDTTPISAEDTCSYSETNWVDVGTDTSATISNLSTATTYYWQVRVKLGDEIYLFADNNTLWAFTTE